MRPGGPFGWLLQHYLWGNDLKLKHFQTIFWDLTWELWQWLWGNIDFSYFLYVIDYFIKGIDEHTFLWSSISLIHICFGYQYFGPLHVLWQVSFGCWVTWSISSWQKYYKSVFFPKAEWWIAELLFLSLNIWGLNFLQNECSQSSQIYPSSEKLRKMFTFQSCKFLNLKIDQNINFAKMSSAK